MARARAHKRHHASHTYYTSFPFPAPHARLCVCRLWVGRGEAAHCIGSGRRGGVLWYCGMWVWRGFEPRGRPVRPAPVQGLTSDSIIPHAPIDSLPFSVFNHARILTSGVYGPAIEAAYFTSASMYSRCLARSVCLWGQRVCLMLGPQVVCGGGVRIRVVRYAMCLILR